MSPFLYVAFSIVILANANSLLLSLLQIPIQLPSNDIEKYLQNVSDSKSDIVVFPSQYFNQQDCISNGINWSKKYHISIVISCNLLSNYSNALLIDHNGNILLNYTQSKHNGNDPNLTSINLKTPYSNNTVTISILLDDDIYYPELARDLMLQNTELIIFPTKGYSNNNTDDIILYTRSFENVMVIARVNRANSNSTNHSDNGRTAVGSTYGAAWNINETFILNPVDNKQQLITISIDLANIRQIRQNSIFGDAFRRPFRYQQLCGLQSLNASLIPPGNEDIIVTVAALQMVPGNSVDDNIKIAAKYIKEAKFLGADIVFMPEMWSIGYVEIFPGYQYSNMSNLGSVYEWLSLSVSKTSNYYNYFKSLSKNLSIAIGISYMEDVGFSNMIPPKNSITLFDRNGNELYTYSKVHTVNQAQDEALTTPGHQFYMTQLDLGDSRGKINIGSMICYDQEFPESARILSQLGVELIIKPNACEFDMGSHWRLRSKSIENVIGIMMANYAYPTKGYMNGESCAYNFDGSVIEIANASEQILLAKFNINDIRKSRMNNIGHIQSHKILRLCDFERNKAFVFPDVFHRVSGSTI